MSAKTITMLQLRRILQLLSSGHSARSIGKQLSVSRNTVKLYQGRVQQSLLSYVALLELHDEALSKILFDPEQNKTHQKDRYLDIQNYIKELEKEPARAKKILTKKLLWFEYKETYPDGYEYSQFCNYIYSNEQMRNTVMHFFHKPGEKLMMDFAGDAFYCKGLDGEEKKYQVFVAVLSYSGYTYVEAVPTQTQPDVLKCMENALAFYGGMAEYIISDNLTSCIKKYDRYDPELTELMDQFCLHYKTAIIPARPRHPKDKPAVERHVRLVYERMYAPLRNTCLEGLKDVNEAWRINTIRKNSVWKINQDWPYSMNLKKPF
jgi:transposase